MPTDKKKKQREVLLKLGERANGTSPRTGFRRQNYMDHMTDNVPSLYKKGKGTDFGYPGGDVTVNRGTGALTAKGFTTARTTGPKPAAPKTKRRRPGKK